MGTPEEIRNSPSPEVQQFINGHPDGPIPLKLAKEDYIERLIGHPRDKDEFL
jgi:phospholipid/cholesterol/gamma-HCH transport system ATP-binding protein